MTSSYGMLHGFLVFKKSIDRQLSLTRIFPNDSSKEHSGIMCELLFKLHFGSGQMFFKNLMTILGQCGSTWICMLHLVKGCFSIYMLLVLTLVMTLGELPLLSKSVGMSCSEEMRGCFEARFKRLLSRSSSATDTGNKSSVLPKSILWKNLQQRINLSQ